MKQVRAVRTRRLILEAAADQFDRKGYAGTPLTCVTKSADISMGALTFHFPTKLDLADAVESSGIQLTRLVTGRIGELAAPPLSKARSLTLSIARLLEESTMVRAAARLTRERSIHGAWTDAWLASLTELLTTAHEQGRLRGGVVPAALAESVQFLITGIEECARCTSPRADRDTTAVHCAARTWDLLLHGAMAPNQPGRQAT
ncbi:TetR family transcriptional regulator [Streptomyces sp. NPDC004327]|uniref:TetR family transcriptional regulator n=1 Tax=unclassified Streptomyces TaxID=2593676 RepID=UPI0036AED42C